AAGRAAVADGVGLAGLALAVVEGAAQFVRRLAADEVDGVPEFRGAHHVGDVLELSDDLAATDLVADLRAELRVVALLVDGIRGAADHRDALVRGGDEVVPG